MKYLLYFRIFLRNSANWQFRLVVECFRMRLFRLIQNQVLSKQICVFIGIRATAKLWEYVNLRLIFSINTHVLKQVA